MHLNRPALHETRLADAIRVVRQRVMANRWLEVWLWSCNWILAVLIVAVATVRSMRGPLLAGVAVVGLAALATAIGVWYRRPSAYGIAQRLDSASRLGDRVSTAVYFWVAEEPSEVMLRQRDDALTHLARVQPGEMFPVRLPAKIWRGGALVAVLAALCAYHSVYGPPISRLAARATQSRTLATVLSPLTRAIEFARAEKQELADLVASNDKDRKATETQKPLNLPSTGDPTGAAKETAKPGANLDMAQALNMANAGGAMQNQAAPNMAQANPNQQGTGAPANSQTASATDQQGNQSPSSGQQSLGQRALQAIENLMNSAFSNQQQNGSQSPPNASQVNNTGTTAMQAMSGSSQMLSAPNQAAQGQTSNSQGSQNQTTPNPGKHTGAGNGTSPWQPREDKDPGLAGNTAKERVELQTTGFRGPPGKDRADVAPGTAQIPLQDVAPQTVTTVNGAGQDSVPPRYRQYVQDYFQHSEK